MRKTWLFVLVALCASQTVVDAQQTTGAKSEPPQAGGSATAFPSYTREEETASCAYGYGTENSSVLDCVAREEDFRSMLAKTWAALDDGFKADCMGRLARRHLNSYYYLDRCIKNAKQDAATPD